MSCLRLVAGSLACAIALGCGGSMPADESAYAGVEPSTGAESAPAAPAPAATHTQPLPSATPPAEPAASEATRAVALGDAPTAPETGDVFLNGAQLGEPDLRELEVRLRQRPEPGKYWYDAKSGLWGLMGHGASGLSMVRLRAAPLARDVSAGTTGVVVNGRELTPAEVAALAALLAWPENELSHSAGNYTLDDRTGLYGPGNRYLGNLSALSGKVAAPKTARCVWLHFDDARSALGRSSRVECD